ncbi:Ig-like domain-containing protein [Cloacibacillus sp.]|uniref:Ig-like domain-containing protein n=1 Tax=Cloacibacillus sp. TaxID=2049023 RepID=UPI0025C334BD|nr:Ig-like domain-containing protein [Cloacibacillus sp.]MCC8057822.1 Ig-like domain-containing protein [Cloacibacillus sp.]
MDWTPISGDYDNPYTGAFDGAGHSVKGYEITKTAGDGYAGFFSYIGEKDGKKGVVRGLTVEGGVNITSATGNTVNAGAVAGWNEGTIEDCRNAAAVIISTDLYFNHAGGIAGQNEGSGTITSCLNDGPVAAKGGSSSLNNVGGIAGINDGAIYNCASRTTAAASDGIQNFAGGIAGESSGKVYNCANLGEVSISAIETSDNRPNYAGGIVGNTSGSSGGAPEIGSCANSGNITLGITASGDVQLDAVSGGVLGKDTGNNVTIENCAWLEGTAERGVGSGTNNTKKLDENAMKNAVTTLTAQTDKRRIPVNGGSTTITFITLPGTPVTYGNNVRNSRASTNSDIITIGKSEIDSSGKITVTAKNKTGDAAVALSADLYVSDFNHGGIIIPTTPLTYSFTRAIEVVEPIHVTGVKITSSKDITLKGFGDTAQLSARVTPDEATNKKIVWSSSAPGIAEVDESGNVTSKSPGTATIWAAASENESISDDCRVTVSEVKALTIVLNIEGSADGKKSLYAGEQFTASARFVPDNATNRKLDWLIGDSSVISLDRVEEIEKGEAATFTALKAGETTTVNVKTKDGSVKGRPTLEITVLKPTVWVNRIELSKEAMQLQSGEHEKLTATLYPADASDKRIEWKSSSENVATVSENGEIVAHNPGQTVVTAKALGTEEGMVVLAGCLVTVTAPLVPVESVKISPEGTALKIGDSIRFTAEVLPADADNKGVTWKSSDEKIATVDANGGVTAVAIGTATITVTTDDGLKAAQATVSVNRVYTSGSGGCAAGVGAMALFALIPLLLKKRRPAK